VTEPTSTADNTSESERTTATESVVAEAESPVLSGKRLITPTLQSESMDQSPVSSGKRLITPTLQRGSVVVGAESPKTVEGQSTSKEQRTTASSSTLLPWPETIDGTPHWIDFSSLSGIDYGRLYMNEHREKSPELVPVTVRIDKQGSSVYVMKDKWVKVGKNLPNNLKHGDYLLHLK